jgi:hypothetical protein
VRIPRRIGAAHFCRDHNFLHQFADDLTFLQTRDFALRMQPLPTHEGDLILGSALGQAFRVHR